MSRVLDLKGSLVPSLAVKIPTEDCEALFHDPVVRLKLQAKEMGSGSGKERIENLKGLNRVCRLARSKWDAIYEDFELTTTDE